MPSEQPLQGRCGARTRNGGHCTQWPVGGAGAGRCKMHGGSAPQVRAAQQHRAAQLQAHQQAERMVARAGVDADPIEHLLDSLYRAAALVEVWGGMVADLDNAAEVDLRDRPGGLRGEVWYENVEVPKGDGDTKTIRVPKADRLLAFNREGMVTTHPFVDEYQRALERRAKFAKLALDAGVAERSVRIAEHQAKLIADVIRSVLTDLDVEMTQEVAATVGRHLRAVS